MHAIRLHRPYLSGRRKFILSLSLFLIAPVLAGAAEKARWQSSALKGSPDPALPYRIKPAYGKLSFDRPVIVEPIPGTNQMVVAELTGKLVAFEDRNDASQKTIIGDIKTKHKEANSVYGLAFHPDFIRNRLVYICYVVGSERPDGTKVSEFKMTSDSLPKLLLETERELINWKGGGHNGGALAFGPDKMLYITTGDATGPSPPDTLKTGQDVSDLPSSLLRIDVNTRTGNLQYGIPADNPFVGMENVRPEIWAYGFRNPWKLSFDAKRGDLWLGDVGWELWELIHRVERGGNYGWAAMEGRQPVFKGISTGPSPVSPPTIDHPHSEAASITGGYVYYGKDLPELSGSYIYGDFQSGLVWAAWWDGVKVTKLEKIAETGLRLVSFGLDHAGELLLLEHERSNQLFRLEKLPAVTDSASNSFPTKLSKTGLFKDLATLTPVDGVMPYDINAPAWADGATAVRHMAIPPGADAKIEGKNNLLRLGDGAVLARTVLLQVPGRTDPRRMETQILMKEEGSWAAYSYIWNENQTDADLAPAQGGSVMVDQADIDHGGQPYRMRYRVPARAECMLCHNPWAEAGSAGYGRQSASPLALFSNQLDNPDPKKHARYTELVSWATGSEADIKPPSPARTLAATNDESASADRRVRSWMHVNCSQCHAFNAGGAATIILDESAATDQMKSVNVKPQQGDLGLGADAMIVKPGQPEKSVLFARIAKYGPGHMPRLGSREVDTAAARHIYAWIKALGSGPAAAVNESAKTAESELINESLATLIKNPSPGESEISKAIDRLMQTPSGALALSGADLAGLSPQVKKIVASKIRPETRPEVREFLERFLPRSARVERLGDGFLPDEVLSLAGDSSRGADLFFANTGPNCVSCHAVGGKGRQVGPDLDGIGKKYDRTTLLKHMVEPSWAIEPQYRLHNVATKDGRVLSGIKQTLPDGQVKVTDAKGETLLKSDEVESTQASALSLMPAGVLRDLTAEQAADLLAYLTSLNKPAK